MLFDLIIKEAWKYQFLTYPNPAVGAGVVVNNKVFISAHKKAGKPHAEVNALFEAFKFFNKTPNIKDPFEIHNFLIKNHNNFFKNAEVFISAHKKAGTPHAEVNALFDAFKFFNKTPNITDPFEIHNFLIKNHNNFFKDAEVFVTLEPCSHIGKTPSCAMLLKHIKPKSVTIGIKDPIKDHSGGVEILKSANIKVNLLNDKRCLDLIEPFIKWQKRFIFFKLATTLNGVITGGYISSNKALDWVHNVRDKIDLLVIGGNTVRIDKPTLT